MMPNYTNKKVYLKCNAPICTDISLVFFCYRSLTEIILLSSKEQFGQNNCQNVYFSRTIYRYKCQNYVTANLHIAKKNHFFGRGILEQNSICYKENATLQLKHSVTYLYLLYFSESILNSDHAA